jgi:hypothetical protein
MSKIIISAKTSMQNASETIEMKRSLRDDSVAACQIA